MLANVLSDDRFCDDDARAPPPRSVGNSNVWHPWDRARSVVNRSSNVEAPAIGLKNFTMQRSIIPLVRSAAPRERVAITKSEHRVDVRTHPESVGL